MRTMTDLYRRNARIYPERPAFVLGEERRSNAAFYERAVRLSGAILGAGVGRQQTVGVFAMNSIEFFETCAACEMVARIPALFNFRSAAPELASLAASADCSVLVFDVRLAEVVEQARTDMSGVELYVCIGGRAPSWATGFEDFLKSGPDKAPEDTPQGDDIGVLFFTSGTTGKPKGVPWSHTALLEAAKRSCMTENPSTLQISPGFHIGGRIPPIAAMWAAGRTVLDEGFEAGRWMEIVERERINTTFMVPVMMQALLDHPRADEFDLSSLEWILAGSTAIPPSLLLRAIERFGQVFYVAYGSTECGGITRMKRTETNTETPERIARLSSVGPTETPVEIVLMDEDGQIVPDGEIGEVCVRSFAFQGYWNNPDATREAMFGDYFRTGDMGRFDANDYLFLVDRRKDMIISGGENIYSREVEDALDRHEDINAVAVIGIPDERWGERVMAIIVLREGAQLDEDSVIEFSRTQLAKYKCPKRVAIVGELPLSGTNKIDKPALRRQYAQPIGASA